MFSDFLFGQHSVEMKNLKPKPATVSSAGMHFAVCHGHLIFYCPIYTLLASICLACKTIEFEISVLHSKLKWLFINFNTYSHTWQCLPHKY